MSTQKKDNTPAKGQTTIAQSKGIGAVEQHADSSSAKGGKKEVEERKGGMKPLTGGKDRNMAKPATERNADTKPSTNSKKH